MDFIYIAKVSWFTLMQAGLSTAIALIAGLPAAFFCARRDFPGRKFLLSLSSVPLCIPPLIIALGYVSFLGNSGTLNRFLMSAFNFQEPPVRLLYSLSGLVLAQGFYNFPIVMKTVHDAWTSLPVAEKESAKLLGASEFRIFRTITIHQLTPSIISSMTVVFIYCFLSFMLVLLFGGLGNSTLEVEIYKSARASLDFKTAGTLALIETLLLTFVTIFYTFLEQNSSRLKGISSVLPSERKKLASLNELFVFIITSASIFVFFLAPLSGIFINAVTASSGSFSPAGFITIFRMKTFLPSLKNTFLTATATGIFCTITGTVYSVMLKFFEYKKSLSEKKSVPSILILKSFPMLPMCVSSVVTGVILIKIVRQGTFPYLILAQTFLSWPFAYRQIYSQMGKIPQTVLDSAAILSKNKLQTIFRVIIPMSKRGILSAFGFSFAISAGDTTLPLILAIPQFDTLSLFTYRLAGAYRFNEACASGLILGILCALIFEFSGRIKK